MAGAAVQRRLTWRIADVVELIDETPRVRSVVMRVPGWPGHLAGQHVDVRLTADDGYQAQRSYSIASPPETKDLLTLTVERIEDGEVSPFLTEELRVDDRIELRGPIGGYFVWDVADGGPLMLVAGGSGVCPLMAMLRHRAARGDATPARLLYSSRSLDDVIYREELEHLRWRRSRRRPHADADAARRMAGLPAADRRVDAAGGGVGAVRAPADLCLRPDAVCRIRCGGARATRPRRGSNQDRAIRTDRRIDVRE